MSRSSLLALAIFCFNTVVGVALMWVNRPRTVATMSPTDVSVDERERLLNVLNESGVVPGLVRVCTVSPCTDGPAVFLENGSVLRVVLPDETEPGQIVEMRR